MPKAFRKFHDPIEVAFTNHMLIQKVQAHGNERKIILGDWASTRPRENLGGAIPIFLRVWIIRSVTRGGFT